MVDEAIEIGADAIILGLPYRKRFGGDFAIGGTIPYVFQNAPCEVIVVREPMPSVTKVETPAPVEKVAAKVGAESSSGSGKSSSTSGSDRLGGWSFRNRSRGNGHKDQGDGG